MKNTLKLMAVICIIVTMLALASCANFFKTEHVHKASTSTVISKEPTCNTPGEEHMYCVECGEFINAVVIPATGQHRAVVVPSVAATCTTTGLTEGQKCGDCGEIIVAQNVVPINDNHKIIKIEAVSATCSTTGLTEGEKCEYCNKVITPQEVIPTNNVHKNETVLEGVPPTCSSTGLTEGSKCTACGTIVCEQKVIELIDHIASEPVVVEPTLKENGSSTTYCTMCNIVLESMMLYATGSEGLMYNLNSDGESYTLIGIGTCTDTDLVIPAMYNGKPVTAIGEYAFEKTPITSVQFTSGNNIKNINACAFLQCTNLALVDLTNSGVTNIATGAFAECTKLTTVIVDETIEYLSPYAFRDCNELEYNVYDNALYLGTKTNAHYLLVKASNVTINTCIIHPETVVIASAFKNCTNITTIELPNTVTIIMANAFQNCNNLTKIYLSTNLTTICSRAFTGCSNITMYYNGSINDFSTRYQFVENITDTMDTFVPIIFNDNTMLWNGIDMIPLE